MISSNVITLRPVDPEVFVVESFESGLQGIYDNLRAAQDHVDEMNKECPNDHYWVESHRLRSE
jgi:hypothetical protein